MNNQNLKLQLKANQISRRSFLRRGASLTAVVAGAAFFPGCQTCNRTSKNNTDITFFIIGDTHYGRTQLKDNEATNKRVIDEMNSAPATFFYPKSLGGKKINTPRAVLVAGDLCDHGLEDQWSGVDGNDGFVSDYGLTGDCRLKYPVYEGFGNHDYELNGKDHYSKDQVRIRNKSRPGITNLSENGFHYSWDWDNVHFINLNLYPGPKGDRWAEAEGSIDFLKEDLVAKVGASGRPVVIYHHFGLDDRGQRWWDPRDRDIYYETIKDYNVIGIFHGHTHKSMVYQWRGIDVYDVGAGVDGEWSAVNITDNELIFANRNKEGWNILARKELEPIAVGQ